MAQSGRYSQKIDESDDDFNSNQLSSETATLSVFFIYLIVSFLFQVCINTYVYRYMVIKFGIIFTIFLHFFFKLCMLQSFFVEKGLLEVKMFFLCLGCDVIPVF